MKTFTTTDSGKHQNFKTGAKRDISSGKGRFDLLPVLAMFRDAALYERGAIKYASRNWEKGMPFSRVMESLLRHAFQYLMGDRKEDHLSAIRFNAGALVTYEEMIDRGLLPASLNDLPSYIKKTPTSKKRTKNNEGTNRRGRGGVSRVSSRRQNRR